jgi:uncharacterized membrane protein
MSRSIKIIFTLSLILNVILLGLVGGGLYRLQIHFKGDRDIQRELQSMPPDVRAKIDQMFDSTHAEMRSLFKMMVQAKQEVRDTLNADPFVRSKYDNAVEKLNQIRFNMMQIRAQKTGEIAMHLTADDRRKFAGYLLRSGGRGSYKDMQHDAESPQAEREQIGRAAEGSQRPKLVQELPFDPVMLPMPSFN